MGAISVPGGSYHRTTTYLLARATVAELGRRANAEAHLEPHPGVAFRVVVPRIRADALEQGGRLLQLRLLRLKCNEGRGGS